MKLNKITAAAALLVCAAGLAACEKKGTDGPTKSLPEAASSVAEKAESAVTEIGDELSEAASRVREGISDVSEEMTE